MLLDSGGMSLVFLSMVLMNACMTVASECPTGYVSRDLGYCCKPTICGPDEGYQLCTGTALNPGYDRCYKCPPGQLSGETINTIDFPIKVELCHVPDCMCPPESRLVNLQECKTGVKKQCQCDINRGFYGLDPYVCNIVNTTMMIKMQQLGYELLLTGEVQECKEGHYKSRRDNSSCVPYKICEHGYKVHFSGSKTQDRTCVRDSFSKTKSKIDVYIKIQTTPAANDSRDEGGQREKTKNDEKIPEYVYVIGATVVVVLLIVTLICIWFCKNLFLKKRLNSDIELDNVQRMAPDPAAPSGPTDNENTGLLTFQPPDCHPNADQDIELGNLQRVVADPATPSGPTDNENAEQPAVQPSDNCSSNDCQPNADQEPVSLNAGPSLDVSSILDEKKPTERQVAIVTPSKAEAVPESESQIHASPEQNDSGELYVGGANTNMFGVQIHPQDHPYENDEETVSKEV